MELLLNWNLDTCFGKNVLEITQNYPGNYSKLSWKLLKNVLESPANDSRHLSGNPDIVLIMIQIGYYSGVIVELEFGHLFLACEFKQRVNYLDLLAKLCLHCWVLRVRVCV